MAVLLDETNKVVVQGITGHQGQFHTKAMMDYGTKVVAGTSPGKAGEKVNGVPVFDAVADAVAATGADTSIIFVPAPYTKDAVVESIEAGVRLIVIITERVPFHDCLDIMPYARARNVAVIGPNTPGIISPGRSKCGIMPSHIFKKGSVGVISRSGTLTYEVVAAMTAAGMGQSTCMGSGGDPIVGTNFVEALKLFEADIQTKSIVLIGEIGGTAEEEAARYIEKKVTKKVAAYVAGLTAPPEKRMGHAGAIIQRGMGTAESKMKAFEKVGVKVAKYPSDIARLL